ncbi:MAG: histone deacetylase family protein [Gammaproteobacteria bacterium]
MPTGLIYDERFRNHDTGPHHPERPERMDAAIASLREAAWHGELVELAARDADLSVIETTHSLDYIRRAESACEDRAPFLDTTDVTISADSWDVAVLAAGTPLVLADAMVDGRIDNGFALLRPPGHHAEREMAMGFCLFNNIAILARYLQATHGMDKIAILDWDVHHGNGTQHSFEEDPSVLYVSLHQYPYYPGTGSASEDGRGRGRGATLNVPMPAGATDTAYERAFMEQVLPALDGFKPECVLISAGFDAHADDPLADVQLSTSMYGWMSLRMLEVADQHADGRLLSVLEGGYHLERLADCVREHVGTLAGAAPA